VALGTGVQAEVVEAEVVEGEVGGARHRLGQHRWVPKRPSGSQGGSTPRRRCACQGGGRCLRWWWRRVFEATTDLACGRELGERERDVWAQVIVVV
jgi:hypothetical protein